MYINIFTYESCNFLKNRIMQINESLPIFCNSIKIMVLSSNWTAPVWYVPNVLREAIRDFGRSMSFGTVNGNNNDNNNENYNNN